MNGEVNHTMEDIIGIPPGNLEKPQEIIETPIIMSVEHNESAEKPLVDSKKQEEVVQMPVAKSVDGAVCVVLSEKSLANSQKQEEIANIHFENPEKVNENESKSFKNVEVPNQIIETIDTNSQEFEEIEEQSLVDSRKTSTTPAIPQNSENIESTSHADINKPESIAEIDIEDAENFDESVKIPFCDIDNTEKILATPIALPDEPEEIDEMLLSDSGEPVITPDLSLIKNDDIKDVIEISLVNSEDSKQSTDLENIDNEDHVIQIPTTKSINDAYNDSSQEAGINGNADNSESNNNAGSDGIRSEVTTIQIFNILPEAEFNSNDVESQHCSNSNGSFVESVASSQIKSETTYQQPIDRFNENSSNYIKSENDSQHSEDVADLDNMTDVDMSEEELKATDTVSINSDTEPENDILIPVNEESSQENQSTVNTIETVKEAEEIEGSNGDSQKASSPEIHEIDSENEDIKEVKSQTREDPVPLRRSSRAIKRKRYTDDLENVDDYEPVLGDSSRHKSRPVVPNNTKILIEMEDKNPRYNQGNKNRKESTVVIITAPSERNSPNRGPGNASYSNQNIHNVHPNTNMLLNRSNTITNNSPQAPSILPSLTDDMFVVEAPSFIVPYVYEKPSMMPFREFVDNLGKELEEERAKQKELLDENKAGQERNEESGDDDGKKKKKEAKKEKRKQKDNDDDDDMSWDGESTTESEEDTLSDEEDKISIVKNKEYTINEIHSISSDLSTNKIISSKSDSYFDCSLGKFFMDIGSNLVQEYVQNDLLKQQNRKIYRAKKLGHSTKSTETSIASLKKNLELSKENNATYTFKLKKCQFCSFKTESSLILAEHLEIPHTKNNLFQCNFCSFEVKSAHEIFVHMETVHNITGKLTRLPGCHQCANCPFEDNSKGKLARHLIPCMKKFKPESNLAPPFDWEPPAKIPKISKARNNMVTTYQSTFNRGQIGNIISRPMNVPNVAPGVSAPYRPRGRSPMPVPPRPAPVLHGLPIMRNAVMVKHNAPIANSNISVKQQKSLHQPSISITPLPRQPQPIQSQQTNAKTTFVICEICDGYIKDLEQLRNHMQSIHKVKIHPKMIYNRPPLNCQKCQFRFFTDQGLERHLLGSHGLVTSSMQEAANKEKDSGRCPVCGRVYQWKLLNHVARDHNLMLKPAHLSYKCTVCAATFGMYKQFENHVYSAHSVVAKRVIDKSKIPPSLNKYHGNSTLLNKPAD